MLWFIGTRVGYERDWSCGFSAEKSVWRRVWGKIKCKGKTTPGLKKSAARVSFNSSVVRSILSQSIAVSIKSCISLK